MEQKMIIGVTGPKGRLGSELVGQGASPLYCDLRNPKQITREIDKVDPDIIINCASKSDVDWCELNSDAAWQANLTTVVNLHGVWKGPLIHISTDYIFDGKGGPYTEIHPILDAAINEYGSSKESAETYLRCMQDVHIVRTSMLYGSTVKKDFVTAILGKLLAKGEPTQFNVVSTLWGTPTYIPHLASALLDYCVFEPKPDILNIAGADYVSRYTWAMLIADAWNADSNLILETDLVNTVAKCPKKAGLSTELAVKLGIPIHSLMDGLLALKEAQKY
jgi:dTDP-4-dehydrorhamnose reductase